MNRRAHTGSLLKVAAALALLLAPMLARGQQNVVTQKDYNDPREMRYLPDYCKYTQLFRDHLPGGNDPEQIEHWTNMLGPTFIHLHHYCWGLMATNRAFFMSPTPVERGYNLNQSITEFSYVIERSPPTFALLPEILTKRGENYVSLDQGAKGVADLRGAIDLKPEYWPPYAAMSDYFKQNGDLAKAREWAEKGLQASPNTRPLERRIAALDAAQGRSKSSQSKR
jgi:tetratricopeptide (TPR) repeat protein